MNMKSMKSAMMRAAMTLLLAVMTTATAVGYNSNEVPHYNLDYIKGGTGCIFIKGWAVDKAYPDRPIGPEFIFYSDAACNNRVWRDGAELVNRPDVNAQYNTTGDHGFEAAIPVIRFADFQFPEGATEHTFYVRVFVNNTSQKVFEIEGSPFPVRVKKIWGEGTEDTPFLICNAGEWDSLADDMADSDIGDYYADKFYELVNEDWCEFDNTTAVTKMWGTDARPFAGNFNGNGKTLNVHIIKNNSTDGLAAPFYHVNGASIHDLTVAGSVSGMYFAGGIVLAASGTLNLQNCVCSAAISGFNMYAGGLIAYCKDLTLKLQNCLFKGSFSPSSNGKYHPIALKNATATVTASVIGAYYVNTISSSEGLDDNVIIKRAKGTPVSTILVDGVWDEPMTAIDGQTYYATHFTGKALPYVYGFENNDLSAEGWTMVDCNVHSRIPTTYESSPVRSGRFAFKFHFSGYHVQYLVSPEFSGHTPILVRFYNLISNNPASCQVGYSTTTSDIDAFTWGETYTSSTTWVWELYEGTFPKGTKYIAIKWLPNDLGVLYLDDFSFTVSDIPSPVNLSAIDVTEDIVSLSWEAPAADYPITGYAYQYKKASDEVWSAEVTVPPTATFVTLNGLSANTDYQFRVKALYGEHGESIYSPVNFTTAMELPYECGFENGMDRWGMVDIYWGYTEISTKAAHDGENGFRFDRYNKPQYIISPRFAGTSEMTVSFYYRDRSPDSGYWETFQVGYSTTTSDLSDFTWSNDIYATKIPWTLYEQTFPVGTRYIAIKYKTDALGLYLDDFSFAEYAPYAKPTDLAVSDLTDQSAKLTWSAPNGATGYAYQYKKPTDDAWSTEATVKTTSVTLDGLEANTNYDFRVKALYAGGNASNYATIRFLTEGAAVTSLPYTEGFENGMGGWRTSGFSSEIYSESSDDVHGGNYSFKLRQYEALISPRFDVSTPLLVSFYYKHYYGTYYKNGEEVTGELPATFQMGYSFTTKDLDAFDWGEPFKTDAEWQKFLCYCPEGTKYVAIRWSDGSLIYLDDFIFTVGTPPSVPHNIAVNNITAYSAELSWTGNNEIYDIRFRKKVDDVGSDPADWKTGTTRNYVRLSRLLPETEYEFQVRSNAYTTYSDWSDVFTFTTNRLVPIYDDKDNTEFTNLMASQTNAAFDVMLVRRTLYKDGSWNTLCLPFSLSAAQVATVLENPTKLMTLNSTTSNLTDGTLTLNFTDATGIEAGQPYLVKWDLPTPDLVISSAAEWEAFASAVNNGTESYEGKLVQLDKDISVSTMAGTADHPFCGTFDGAGYTLNLSISGADYAAPFHYINGATVCNLKVEGSVNGGQYSAGIVGAALGGTNSIRNCWMAASVTGQTNIGGILGHGNTSATTISNCYLSGNLSSSNIGVLYGGGSAGGTHAVENCCAMGEYSSGSGITRNLVLTDGGTVSVTNCRQNISEAAQGSYDELNIVVGGSYDSQFVDFLGNQWMLNDNGGLALKHTTDVANITSPIFRYVRVSSTITPVETDHVDFIGITSPATLAADDRSVLYLDTDNTFRNPTASTTLNACRAYFQLKNGITVNEGSSFVLNVDGISTGLTTGVEGVSEELRVKREESAGAVYDLSGRKVNGQSSNRQIPKGVYVKDGRRVVIK